MTKADLTCNLDYKYGGKRHFEQSDTLEILRVVEMVLYCMLAKDLELTM